MTEAFLKAQQLLGQDPLPADIEQQLEDLEKQIDKNERAYFGDLWEALEAVRHLIPPKN